MWGVRGVLRSLLAGAALVTAFAVGLVVGVAGDADRPPPPPAPSAPVQEAAARISADAERPVAPQALDSAAITGMLGALGDPYASYSPAGSPADPARALGGSYAGLGLWLRAGSGGTVLLASVLPDSPAARGGLTAGEELLSVDGRPARGRSVADIVAALRGAAGSTVRVVTRGDRGRLREVSLVRGELAAQDVVTQRLPGSVLRVRVASFSAGVGQAVRRGISAARATAPLTGVVLDLRGDPGGLLDEAVTVAGTFLDGGPVVSYQRRGEAPRVLTAEPGGDTRTLVAVLVDRSTASAAEVVAAALQDRQRALVVGTRSFGKGTVQEPVRLSDGSALELTVAHYRTPAGRVLDGVGVTPDIAVAAAPVAPSGPDPALDRAVSVVGGLLADAGSRAGTGPG